MIHRGAHSHASALLRDAQARQRLRLGAREDLARREREEAWGQGCHQLLALRGAGVWPYDAGAAQGLDH
eukprot:5031192-Lingulodinium_polyedra.AAC.1